ncbi:Elongation factor Tu GTP binding domain containing protein, putative [Angomonas deanei]|uniref:Elongation factor Tu GTP binding domain containing protein, putative n=1 Tax=Angomonas deanei TaxID=59799 RepID=A0A7G2C8A0_9TRYP|nr:Elongation factor Tu GTP binding domain containing protein, putative [Angomonas deanei]
MGDRMKQFSEDRRLRETQVNAHSDSRNTLSPTDTEKGSSPTTVGHLTAEDDEGNVEYKWRLTGISEVRLQHLVTQMKFRVAEGKGQCLYELGVTDDGVPKGLSESEIEESTATIERMASQLGYSIVVLKRCNVQSDPVPLYCAEILVSRHCATELDFGVSFCGPVDSGKSSLIAVLLTGTLDDGEGRARQLLFNHKHEINSGRTSSIAMRLWEVSNVCTPTQSRAEEKCITDDVSMALPAAACSGKEAAWPSDTSRTTTPTVQVEEGGRLISLMDFGGDVTKTMLFGLMCHMPEYVCICNSSQTPPADIAIYANICRTVGIPFLVTITKSDFLEEFEADNYFMEVSMALSNPKCYCEVLETAEDAERFCATWPAQEAADWKVPVFLLSSVTGDGLDTFRAFLTSLRGKVVVPDAEPSLQSSFEIFIEQSFLVQDVNIVRGRVAYGQVAVGSPCFIGPDEKGAFHEVRVIGIHVGGVHVNCARQGDDATFAIDSLPDCVDLSTKGKVLTTEKGDVTYEFTLSVQVLTSSLVTGMEPILYSRNIRQAVDVVAVQDTEGGRVLVQGRFKFRPEMMKAQSPAILQWTNGTAAGVVHSVYS